MERGKMKRGTVLITMLGLLGLIVNVSAQVPTPEPALLDPNEANDLQPVGWIPLIQVGMPPLQEEVLNCNVGFEEGSVCWNQPPLEPAQKRVMSLTDPI
jgi:hypothetical protein